MLVPSHCFLHSMNFMQVFGKKIGRKQADDLLPFEILRNPEYMLIKIEYLLLICFRPAYCQCLKILYP